MYNHQQRVLLWLRPVLKREPARRLPGGSSPRRAASMQLYRVSDMYVCVVCSSSRGAR